MKKNLLIFVLFVLGEFIFAHFILAQGITRDEFVNEYHYDLNLTEEQIQEISKLEIRLEKELTPFYSQIRELRIKLDELEIQRTPNMAEIDKVIAEIYRVEDQMMDKENQYYEKIRGLLTAEQRIKFDSIYGYGASMGYGLGRFGWRLGPRCLRGGFGWGAGREIRGYDGWGDYYSRYGPRYGYGRGGYGYGRGLAGSRFNRFYNYRFIRDRFIR